MSSDVVGPALPPHVISATVNGERRTWKYHNIGDAVMIWKGLVEHRLVPGTNDAVSDLELLIGGQTPRVTVPNDGWAGPRAKEDIAE